MLAVFVITIAAAEVAVGIGLILLCYRRWHAADVDRYDTPLGLTRDAEIQHAKFPISAAEMLTSGLRSPFGSMD